MFSINLAFPVAGMVGGIIALLFGIIILANPATLNVIVGITFIIQGIMAIAQYYRWY